MTTAGNKVKINMQCIIIYNIKQEMKRTFTSWSSHTPSSISLTIPGHISSQIVARVTVVGSSVHEGGSGCINRSIPRVREGATVNNYTVYKNGLLKTR